MKSIIETLKNQSASSTETLSLNSAYRRKALKGLAAFIAVMLLFTVLSRAADSLTVPKVSVQRPDKKTLDRTITATGVISQNQEQAISVKEGLKIESVYVSRGDRVSKDDILMELDLEYLNEQILLKQREIKKTELTLNAMEESQNLTAVQQEKKMQRAQEDYEKAVSQGNKAVTQAYEDMTNAYSKWQDFKTQGMPSSSDQITDSLKNSLEKAEIRLLDAQQALEDLEAEMETLILEQQAAAQEEAEIPLTVTDLKEIEDMIQVQYSQALTQAEANIFTAQSDLEDSKSAYETYLDEQLHHRITKINYKFKEEYLLFCCLETT